MASRKHDLIDISASEDEADRGYDSEENAAESKGRSVKRRRTADNQDPFGLESDEDESDLNEEEEEEPRPKGKGKGRKQIKTTEDTDEEDEDEDEELSDEEDGGASLDVSNEPSSKPKTKLLNSKLAKLTSGKPPKKDKSGVVYLSSLPPYLKPVSIISPHFDCLCKSISKTDTKSSSRSRIC
jgi:ESF2/ABP1 family protein